MTEYFSHQSDVILLDIEGTTTPVEYVFGVLFPFAKDNVEAFLQTHDYSLSVEADLKLLRLEYDADRTQGISIPDWNDNLTTGVVPYIHYLIEVDRKSTGLKSLQGKIWEQGYRDGKLRSRIFPDIKPAFERWKRAGKQLFIFSSGSVLSQRLLFQYTEVGDLTGFLSGYFDTEIGAKKEPDSYRKIAQTIGVLPQKILFISDVTSELRASQSAGMQILFSFRPGNHSSDSEGFEVVNSFDLV